MLNNNKLTCASYVISPFKLSVRGVTDNPKTVEAIAIVLSWPPELGGKTLLLWTPHTWSQDKKNPVGTGQEASSMLASSYSPGRLLGEVIVLPNREPSKLRKWSVWQDICSRIQRQCECCRDNQLFSDGVWGTLHLKKHTWYCKSSWEPRVGSLTDLGWAYYRHSVEWTQLQTVIQVHLSMSTMPPSVLRTEASLYNGWWLSQNLITSPSVEYKHQCGAQQTICGTSLSQPTLKSRTVTEGGMERSK